MDCEKTRENLDAYLDGELDEREKAAVEEHLAACTGCAAELERLRRLVILCSSRTIQLFTSPSLLVPPTVLRTAVKL